MRILAAVLVTAILLFERTVRYFCGGDPFDDWPDDGIPSTIDYAHR